jgi:photosystem II stability/assembly factor-like uncharacterized protein
MKTKIKAFFLLSICMMCNKAFAQLPDTLSQNHYYSNEIFPQKYLDIYNRWVLTGISGGFTGQGYKPDFDYMEIEKYGIYKLYRNDSLLHYGKIKIENESSDRLLISFIRDTSIGNISFYDMIKYVTVSDSSLGLGAPCCDRYNYSFKSCDYFDNTHFHQEVAQIEGMEITPVEMEIENCNKKAVCFPSIDTGFIGSYEGKIYKTIDGGKTWVVKLTDNDLPIYKIYFLNNLTGFAVGGNTGCSGSGCIVPGSIVYKTTDSGENWERISIPYKGSELYDIHFINDSIGFAAGLGLNIKTNDKGETWQEFDIGLKGMVMDIDFLNETTGFACSTKGSISKTIDKGAIWRSIDTLTSKPYCIKFINENTGLIGQYNGQTLRTNDGGQTWSYLNFGPSNVTQIFYNDTERLIAFGDNSYSSKYCNVWNSSFNLSDDFGMTWKGDNRIIRHFDLVSQVDPNMFYGISNGKLFRIQKSIIITSNLLKDNNRFNGIYLYPNPTQDFINIRTSLDLTKGMTYEIFNFQGILVDKNILSSFKIDISYLSGGVYILKLVGEKKIYTEKFIIEKNSQ